MVQVYITTCIQFLKAWKSGSTELVNVASSALLIQIQLPGATRDFSPLSQPTVTIGLPDYGVYKLVQPLYTTTRINICVHVKNPRYWQTCPSITVWTHNTAHQVNPQRWNVAAQVAGELKLVTDIIYLPENQVQKKTRNKYVSGPHSCQNYLRVFKFQHTESEVEAKCQLTWPANSTGDLGIRDMGH